MTPEDIENCWNDPNNHRWGVYYCPEDPRIIVPRRVKWMGWTINFARPSALPVLLVMGVLVIVPVAYVKAIGGGAVDRFLAGAVGIAAVCLWSAYLSSTARWTR